MGPAVGQDKKAGRGRAQCQSTETHQLIKERHHFALKGGSCFLSGTKRLITSIEKATSKGIEHWANQN